MYEGLNTNAAIQVRADGGLIIIYLKVAKNSNLSPTYFRRVTFWNGLGGLCMKIAQLSVPRRDHKETSSLIHSSRIKCLL